MKLKKINIGNLITDNNVFLAPMAGYTDAPFRRLAIKLGVGMTFTELVSSRGLYFGGANNDTLLSCENYLKTAAQIFGADEFYMRKACESEYLSNYKVIDINMGCPVPKVFKNGEGSALLKDVNKAEKIISECVKSGKIITVKIRTGLKSGDDIASEFAKAAENAGASLVTVHGRVRENYYSGEPDFVAIEKAKKSVRIPVIANGGIFSASDADSMLDKTGADGVMLARGAAQNPFLISELVGMKTDITLKAFIFEQLSEMKNLYGNKRAALEFRKYVCGYFKGMQNTKEAKNAIMLLENTDAIAEIIDKTLS